MTSSSDDPFGLSNRSRVGLPDSVGVRQGPEARPRLPPDPTAFRRRQEALRHEMSETEPLFAAGHLGTLEQLENDRIDEELKGEDGQERSIELLVQDCRDITDRVARLAQRDIAATRKSGRPWKNPTHLAEAKDIPLLRATLAKAAIDDAFAGAQGGRLRRLEPERFTPADVGALERLNFPGLWPGDEIYDSNAFFVPPDSCANLVEHASTSERSYEDTRHREFPWTDASATLFFATPFELPAGSAGYLADGYDDYMLARHLPRGHELLHDDIPFVKREREVERELRKLTFAQAVMARSRLNLRAMVVAATFPFEDGIAGARTISWLALQDTEQRQAVRRVGALRTFVDGSALDSFYAHALSCLRPRTASRRPANLARPKAQYDADTLALDDTTLDSDDPYIHAIKVEQRPGSGHVVAGVGGWTLRPHNRRATVGARWKIVHGERTRVMVPIAGAQIHGGLPDNVVVVYDGIPSTPPQSSSTGVDPAGGGDRRAPDLGPVR